jgi:hypothetical protein
MDIKRGSVVMHKASNQKMVVLNYGSDWQNSEDVRCRFLNTITGKYEVIDLWVIEIKEVMNE